MGSQFSKQIGYKANDGSNVASHKRLILNGFSGTIPKIKCELLRLREAPVPWALKGSLSSLAISQMIFQKMIKFTLETSLTWKWH